MTWEETIRFIRTKPEYKFLVEKAYFEEELPLNVERFKNSEEFAETNVLLSEYISINKQTKLLDIGSGNGISAVAFALSGINVDSVEPDPSETIGAGAIRRLKDHYKLENLNVYEGFAEDLGFKDNKYDIVYVRQCMHHAHDLEKFIKECSRVLKKGGVLITVRDHVIYNEKDKQWFLENHPLQKFYGGENAFTEAEYKKAMENADLSIKVILKHFESVINYFPLLQSEKDENGKKYDTLVDSIVDRKLFLLGRIPFLKKAARNYVDNKLGGKFNETKIPGRMYTFLAIKN